jgi:hypothetical protein
MRLQESSSPRICLAMYCLSLKMKALRFCEMLGTTYRTNGTPHTSPKRRGPLTERTTHRTHVSETSGTTHRTNGTPQHISEDLHAHLLTVVSEENNCETQSCCSCWLGVRDCLMLGKTRGVREDSVLLRAVGCCRHGQYCRRFQSSGM